MHADCKSLSLLRRPPFHYCGGYFVIAAEAVIWRPQPSLGWRYLCRWGDDIYVAGVAKPLVFTAEAVIWRPQPSLGWRYFVDGNEDKGWLSALGCFILFKLPRVVYILVLLWICIGGLMSIRRSQLKLQKPCAVRLLLRWCIALNCKIMAMRCALRCGSKNKGVAIN